MEEVLNLLEQTAAHQRLEELAMRYCRTALINSSEEDQEAGLPPLNGYDSESIQLHVKKHSLVFKNKYLPHPYIDTEIGLYKEDKQGIYLDNLEPVGEYRLITRLDGEIEDGDLVLYDKKAKAVAELVIDCASNTEMDRSARSELLMVPRVPLAPDHPNRWAAGSVRHAPIGSVQHAPIVIGSPQ
jgi:hypothetical protein